MIYIFVINFSLKVGVEMNFFLWIISQYTMYNNALSKVLCSVFPLFYFISL